MTAKGLTLEEWIYEAMTDSQHVGEGKPGLRLLSLIHKVGTTDTEVYSYVMGSGAQSTPKAFAEMFESKATTHVQHQHGFHTFNVLAFYGATIPANRYPFTKNIDPPADGNITEAPTPQGRMQQTMRREEMLFGILFQQQQHLNQHALQVQTQLREENRELRGENAEMFAFFKQITMEKILKDREHELSVMKARNQAALMNKVVQFAPALMNTVAGREVFPQATADKAMMDLIADNIKPEYIPALDNLFGPELAAALKLRIEQRQKEVEKEALDMAALYPQGTDPEKDASGEPQTPLQLVTGGKK